MKTNGVKPANIVFVNGEVYTVDKERSWAETVAVVNDKIVYVGDNEGARDFIGEETKVIDLGGKMILPGFIDAHAHPLMSAFWLTGVMIDIESDYDEVLQTIKKFVVENPDKNAYFGLGYNEDLFDKQGPRKEALDEICPHKPILIQSSGGHAGWVNSKALEMAGVDKEHPDPIPGFQYYKRDTEGNPTGCLIECGPIAEITAAINPFDQNSVEASLNNIFEDFSSLGITAVADCGIFSYFRDMALPLVEKLNKSGKTPFRIVGSQFVSTEDEVVNAIDELKELNKKYDDDMFRINVLKIINDGTVEARSASLFEDYSDGMGNSEALLTGQNLYNLCVEAAKAGLNICIHAIGDRAIYESLMAAKAVREAGYHDTRFTNAHTEYVRKEDRELFGKYNVIANSTGVWFVYYEGNETALGNRAKELFTMKTVINSGAKVTFGSDFPVSELGHEPLKSIEVSITRQFYGDKDYPVLEPVEERLTIEEAIEAYTINPAYQIGMEEKLGSIEIGKYADLVVLGENIFETDIYSIHKIPVVMTMTNGKLVYDANDLSSK